MNLHEYQGKALLSRYGISIPDGRLLGVADDRDAFVRQAGDGGWVIKAQVHAGGRGKAGGVRIAADAAALRRALDALLGSRLATAQGGADGQPVNSVLIEPLSEIARELYLGVTLDRARERIVYMLSPAGGMDIEDIAARTPEQILTLSIDPVVGLQPYQCRRAVFFLGLDAEQGKILGRYLSGLYRLFLDNDASLLEINPLAITAAGELLALDAKITIDDNALYRQRELATWRDPAQDDAREQQAQQHGLNYISLDGDIACMVNGAGLAMATMDLIKLHDGEPANFLDVGGGTTAAKVTEAFKLILTDNKVRAILVNIFGGIVRCDLIAEGLIAAVREVGIDVPIVVRLEGTRAEQGLALIADSGLGVITAADLDDAAKRAVAAAKEA